MSLSIPYSLIPSTPWIEEEKKVTVVEQLERSIHHIQNSHQEWLVSTCRPPPHKNFYDQFPANSGPTENEYGVENCETL
jgi:hypothetical protein